MGEVGTYATRSEAELAQAALVAAGVTSRLVADAAAASEEPELFATEVRAAFRSVR
jgi:hypothetical protein